MRSPVLAGLLAGIATTVATPAFAQQGEGTNVSTPITIFKPAQVPATPERIAALRAPPGFSVTPVATRLKNARIIAVAPGETVYLSCRDQGDVLMLKDTDGDGRADGAPVTVANRRVPTGSPSTRASCTW